MWSNPRILSNRVRYKLCAGLKKQGAPFACIVQIPILSDDSTNLVKSTNPLKRCQDIDFVSDLRR